MRFDMKIPELNGWYFVNEILKCILLNEKWLHFDSNFIKIVPQAQYGQVSVCSVNTLRPRRNEQHFADDIFKRIFFNENGWISIKISLKFVPAGQINNIPSLVQIMAWRRPGDKPLSEPMMVSVLTHICVTRPQWVNGEPMMAKINDAMFQWNKRRGVIEDANYWICFS